MTKRGQIPLSSVVCLSILSLILLGWWTYRQTRTTEPDGRQPIVFWGSAYFEQDIYNVVHAFERKNPEYRVILSSAAARNLTDDAQRLMCAVAGGVPPDVVWFDRFALGEWASRGAVLDFRPLLEAQAPDDPARINLDDFYDWAIAECSFAPPGSQQTPGLFGIPSNADVRVLYINGDALRQAGLVDEKNRPHPPRTWDELLSHTQKLTLHRTPGDTTSPITRLGFAPHVGNSWLYLYAFQAGGDMMNADRTRVTMDSPPVVRALRFMTSLYDAAGSYASVEAFAQSQQAGALHPFITGKLAMQITGDDFLRFIADWKPQMDFAVAPPPMPADQLEKGVKPLTWSGGWAYVIPATSRNVSGAFK
ncbi:MAG TPA: extracellular solute-binding protein, partial [Tepidisphaeraceae bacterium]